MNATNATIETNWVDEVGAPAAGAIREMVAALECDYERLEELKGERNGWDPEEDDAGGKRSWADADPDDAEELAALILAAGDCADRDEAEQRIGEDALSIEVRCDWHALGSDADDAAEFCILLTTGGPAVRIIGELDIGSPIRPRLEVQDWFKPWTEYFEEDQQKLQATLQAYCDCFYFGD